nr:uncharacterized protein LOC126055343 [Helicoverpa armigera]
MWKVITFSVLLVLCQAAKIEDFYGDWLQAAFYPISAYVPVCIRFSFTKPLEDVQCTYSDGTNATSVQVAMMTDSNVLTEQFTMPMMIVDTPDEVTPALNLTARCGDKEVKDRAVVRLLNKDTFVMYQNIPRATESETEKNSAYIFTRNPVSSEKLYELMTTIEDLKGRRGVMMCATENYGGFKV